MSAEDLRKKYHDLYKTILGRNKYDQGRRTYVYKKAGDGNYYSDCSSSQCATFNEIGIKMGLLNTAGMYTSSLFKKVDVTIRNGHVTDVSKLRIGDQLFFRGSDPSRPLQIGHVEGVYEIVGNKESGITLAGHGSGKPSLKNLEDYCTSRERQKAPNGKTKGLVCVMRCIADDPKSDQEEDKKKDPKSSSPNSNGSAKKYKIEGCSLLNVRKKPTTTNSSIAKVLEKGDIVYITSITSSNWGKLKDGSGYISMKYAKKM